MCEDAIDHTPSDETVRMRLGSAFDVVGERHQVVFRIDHARREIFKAFEVKVRNQKKTIAAGGESVVRYTVRHGW